MTESNIKSAMVFNIQRYSVHDGPGIRTAVFFKGCNLHCVWCENPESISSNHQVAYHSEQCINCGECGRDGLSKTFSMDGEVSFDKITGFSMIDVERCPSGALETVGRYMTVGEMTEELLRDREYFAESGGGVTISGGEASIQYELLFNLLVSLRREGIHSVLQTNGLMPWKKLKKLSAYVSLFHFDIKGLDPEKHRANTGVDNYLILENARRLSIGGFPVVFRIPLVPGLNDLKGDISSLTSFLNSIRAEAVDIIPYHNMGESKIDVTGMKFDKLHLSSMSTEAAHQAADSFICPGRIVMVSGSTISEK